MSEAPPIPPKEPHLPRLELAKDTLGRELVQAEYLGTEYRFELDRYEREATFLRDLKTFYGISDADAESRTNGDLNEEYEFPDDIVEHLDIARWSSDTIANAQKNNQRNHETAKTRRALDENLNYAVDALRKDLGVCLGYPYAAQLVDEEFDNPATQVPSFINQLRQGSDGTQMSWSEWLTTGATNEQFMNFLQWHNQHMVEVQSDPKMTEEIAREKQEYQAAVQKGIDEGWLPSSAKRAATRAGSVKAHIVDVFGTVTYGIAGYHIRKPYNFGQGDIYLASSHITECTKHELNHSVFVGYTPAWFDEAITEHIAQSMQTGEFTGFDGHLGKGSYHEERELMDALLKGGAEEIPPEVITRAYASEAYAPGSVTQPSKERAALNEALDRSWGVPIFGTVDSTLQSLAKRFESVGEQPGQAYEHALRSVTWKLRHNPRLLIGDDYQKPKLSASSEGE